MSLLTSRLSSNFGAATRSKGATYYYRDSVTFVEGDAYSAIATVRGGSYYDVKLSVENEILRVYCSCPHFETAYCKHIWATMMAAPSEGFLGAGRSVRTIARLNGRPDPVSIEIPPPPPPWQERLVGLSQSIRSSKTRYAETGGAQRQVFYLINVKESLMAGAVSVRLGTRDLKANGEWGKLKTQGLSAIHYGALPDPADRQILAQIAGAKEQYYYPYSFNDAVTTNCKIFTPLDRILIPMMCRTGRCRLTLAGEVDDMPSLEWDGGDPWQFTLEVTRDDSAGQYILSGSLKRVVERMSLSAPALLIAGGMIFTRERAALLDDSGAFEWISHLRYHGQIEVPLEHKNELMEHLLQMPRLPKLELAEELRFREEKVAPRPRLRIGKSEREPYYRMASARLQGDVSFDYAGEVVAANEKKRGVFQAEQNRYILRDIEEEREFSNRLIAAGFRQNQVYSSTGPRSVLELTPSKLPRVVRDLLGEGWHVEAEGKLYRNPGSVRLDVSSGIDWFELHASVDFGGTTAGLPQLLAALRRGENAVLLGDGSFGLLPEDWLKKYGMLAALGSASDDHLRFSRGQAGLLDALLASQPEATFDAGFARVREELQRFQGIEAEDPPAGFVGQLRGYQRQGLGWLYFLQRFGFGGCLADCMGLGKTVMALALLESRRERRSAEIAANGRAKRRIRKGSKTPRGHMVTSALPPSLLVVPRSLVFNWKQEAERFTPELRLLDHTGVERGKTCEHFHDYDVVITTYGTLRRDVLQFKDFQFDYVILDETQAIKNAKTESAKAARLLQGAHRLALSGTPVENHLGELWSLFEFLNPGLLGTASVFNLAAGARNPQPETRELLAKALRPFILRRTKEQVAKELPAKLEQTIYCEMEAEQRKLYDELRDHYRRSLLGIIDKKGIGRSKIQILEALLRLRQAACHPGLIDGARLAYGSAKLDVLLPQLTELMEEGHKALVFSQFTSLLAIVRKHLDDDHIEYEYLDGRTRDRGARVDRFQNDPDCKLFLVSLKAGGLGLNLTAAEYVFLLDPWWNPAVESQAIDRAHRIGQTRQVFAYRLIARDTVEEKVLELQKTKKALADSIINADNSLIRDLDREDLELLLS